MRVLILAAKPIDHGIFLGSLESPLLIPFNGKPLIYNFENQFGNFEIIYAIAENAIRTERLISVNFSRFALKIPMNISTSSPEQSILFCLKKLEYPDDLLVLYGDNLYLFPELPTKEERSIRYTYALDYRNPKYTFFDDLSTKLPKKSKGSYPKSKRQNLENYLNVGSYFFKRTSDFVGINELDFASKVTQSDFKPQELTKWTDLGHTDLIKRHNFNLLGRSFNTLTLATDKTSIMKESNDQKLKREFEFLSNIPRDFKYLFPRVSDFESQGDSLSYSIEFWPLKSVSEIIVFWNLDSDSWARLIFNLLELIVKFSKYEYPPPKKKIEASTKSLVYLNHLSTRLSQYPESLKRLLEYDRLTLNKKVLEGFPKFEFELKKDLIRIGKDIKPSFYHGDFCLSNILYSPSSELIKLIDPKGSLFLGDENINSGDSRYDLAKLCHSILGGYDFFTYSMFAIKENITDFELEVFGPVNFSNTQSLFKEIINHHYASESLHDVRILTAMIFLSIIPLHADSEARMKAFFLTALRMLNEIYDE